MCLSLATLEGRTIIIIFQLGCKKTASVLRQEWLCRNCMVPQWGWSCWGSAEDNSKTHPGGRWRWDFFCVAERSEREARLGRAVVFDVPASSHCNSATPRHVDLEVSRVTRMPLPSASSCLSEDGCILSSLQGHLYPWDSCMWFLFKAQISTILM